MMLGTAPAADAGRALFVGRRRMGATILRWLMVLIHLIWKQPVTLAQVGVQAAASARSRAAGRGLPEMRFRAVRSRELWELPRFAAARAPMPIRPGWKRVSRVCAEPYEPFAGARGLEQPLPDFRQRDGDYPSA